MKKNKVVHVITRMIIGGAQENTLYTVEGISHDFDTILVTGPTEGPEGKLFDTQKNDKKCHYKLKLEKFLCRQIHPVKDLLTLIKLAVYFKRTSPDIVHTHSSKAGILGRIAAFLAGTPIIIHTIHGLPFHEYQNKYINFMYILCEKICAYITTKTICVADAMSDKCLEKNIGNTDLYCTIRSGIDYEMFYSQAKKNFREKYNIPSDAVIIGKIARLFELKGYEYVIEAAKNIIEKYPKAFFMFVGGGNLEQELKRRAESYGIAENVIFTGLVEPHEVPAHINSMDIVVHASLREGLARVIPQAYLLKKPVVSFDVDGAKEIIEHNENGFLLEPKDIEGIERSLEKLILDKDLRQSMAEKGYEKVHPAFSKELMCSEIMRLYKNELEKI